MVIQCDTREHKKEWKRIQSQFDSLGVQYFRSKLYCGDYQSLDNAKLCIDRKKDLQELCGNVCQQHERFKAELIRAREADIKSVGDVYFWENPRKHKVIWRTVNGKRVKAVISDKAVDGCQLYKSLCTIRDKYGVQFEFCTKEETGRRILELLS